MMSRVVVSRWHPSLPAVVYRNHRLRYHDMMFGFVLLQLNVVVLLDLQCLIESVSLLRLCDCSDVQQCLGCEVLDCAACFRYHLPVFRKD